MTTEPNEQPVVGRSAEIHDRLGKLTTELVHHRRAGHWHKYGRALAETEQLLDELDVLEGRAAAVELESAADERGTRSQQRVGRRREKPPLRMWLVVEPVLEVPELQAWCPVSLHHDETEAKRSAHRLGGGRKAVRAFLDFHVPKWKSPTAKLSREAGH